MQNLVYWFQTVTITVFINEFFALRFGENTSRFYHDPETKQFPNDYVLGKFNKHRKNFAAFICDLDSQGKTWFPIALENWYNKNHQPIKLTKEILDSVVLESDLAHAMQNKGYEFAIIFDESDNIKNLYTKTFQDATDLMYNEYKHCKNYKITNIQEVSKQLT